MITGAAGWHHGACLPVNPAAVSAYLYTTARWASSVRKSATILEQPRPSTDRVMIHSLEWWMPLQAPLDLCSASNLCITPG